MESLSEVRKYFSLGEVKTEVISVSGGLIHKMWRVQTNSGIYAVKKLNPEVIKRPKARQDYLNSEKIVQIMKNKGIPSVPALTVNDDPLFESDEGTFMVFPWVEGKVLASKPSSDQIFKVGEILGKIHSLKLIDNNRAVTTDEEKTLADWEKLTKQAENNYLEWSKKAAQMQDIIAALSISHPKIMSDLNKHRVISHRDMDKKNIMWQEDGSPIVIDWESAGLINPGVELVGLALDWSGLQEGKVDKSLVVNFIEGYKSTGETFTENPKIILDAIEGNWLEWLEYNMRRSISENNFPKEEQKIGTSEVTKVLTIIDNLEKNQALYSTWF